VITGIRRWVARAVAAVVTVLTLGLVSVDWQGVKPVSGTSDEGSVADDDLRPLV
jgi:hypothetical protein